MIFSYAIFSWYLLDHSDVVSYGLGIFLDSLPFTVRVLFCSCPVVERVSSEFDLVLFPLLSLMWDPLPPVWEGPFHIASDFEGLLSVLTVLITWYDAFLVYCFCLPLWFHLHPLSFPALCCPHLSRVPFTFSILLQCKMLVFGEPCVDHARLVMTMLVWL